MKLIVGLTVSEKSLHWLKALNQVAKDNAKFDKLTQTAILISLSLQPWSFTCEFKHLDT